jgi:hypothetical protein
MRKHFARSENDFYAQTGSADRLEIVGEDGAYRLKDQDHRTKAQ